MITNDAVAFGLLALILATVFNLAARPSLHKFFNIVPALLLCYFFPAVFNSLGFFSHEVTDSLYYVSSRYMLPAALILLCLNIDLKGIWRLGPKAIIMFLTATLSIVVGGPIALVVVGWFAPEIFDASGPEAIWRGLSTIAGSWIGGGANQTAMKEIYGASDSLFSAMIVVDIFVANIWMAVLLFGAGISNKIDAYIKADNSAIEDLRNRIEKQQAAMARMTSFKDLMMILGIAFAIAGASHLLADWIAPVVNADIEAALAANPKGIARMFTSFGSEFFWLVVFATLGGTLASFTPLRLYEGAGASRVGSVLLYILVATIGMHMNLGELAERWDIFKYVLTIGFVWMAIHITILLIVARIIRAPFFFVAVGSQANVGGAASAPVVASAFSPALAPVAVLLAVLGYALGTFGAIVSAMMMQVVN